MIQSSPALSAAIRALRGDTDLTATRAAFCDASLARVLAMASSVDPVTRAVAALAGGLTAALTPHDVASPAVHAAVRDMIGPEEGYPVIQSWADVAPAGWGADIAAALIDAVQKETCTPAAAAALIGPCDEAAALLARPYDIAFAIRRWGQAALERSTAWTMRVSEGERQRLLAALRHEPAWVSVCLPWLPPEAITADMLKSLFIWNALAAFAEAAPVDRDRHADILAQLIVAARPCDLSDLTLLAYATHSDAAWQRIHALASEAPDFADKVVNVVPWNDAPKHVQETILSAADRSYVCFVIAAAQGRRKMEDNATWASNAFFAAIDPVIWDSMDATTQRRWLRALFGNESHLAVRSLGLRPEILACAWLDNNLIAAARRHTCDADALRDALLPVALRVIAPDIAYALIAGLPAMPRDPGAFFAIASERGECERIDSVRTTLHTTADLAFAVTLQRCAINGYPIRGRCATVQNVVRGRTWDDMAPIGPLLDDHGRTVLGHNLDALADDLARQDQRIEMRRLLASIAALPPEIGASAILVLEQWRTASAIAHEETEALAHTLRDYGDLFWDIINALRDNKRCKALPPPLDDPGLSHALRALIHDDPVVGWNLALALHDHAWNDVHAMVSAMPQAHADAVLIALAGSASLAQSLAAESCADDLRPVLRRMASSRPFIALTLAMLTSDDPDARAAAIATLADTPPIARAIFPLLRPDIRTLLRAHPVLVAALADLTDDAMFPQRPLRTKRRSIRHRT